MVWTHCAEPPRSGFYVDEFGRAADGHLAGPHTMGIPWHRGTEWALNQERAFRDEVTQPAERQLWTCADGTYANGFVRRSARERRASTRIPTVGLRAALVFRNQSINQSIGPQASGDLLDLAAAVRAQCGVGGRAAIIQTQIRK